MVLAIAAISARSLALAGFGLDSLRCLYQRAVDDGLPTLMGRLAEHGRERHAPPDGQLLRYASGRPVISRRYDHLWTRIGRHLPGCGPSRSACTGCTKQEPTGTAMPPTSPDPTITNPDE